MISFIVIGKNIQNTIGTNLDSIIRFVEYNQIKDYEIIFVDSDSKDNTLETAKGYPTRIFLVTGSVNSAIARNVGAEQAKGDILFFLDGDMELLPEFFDSVFNKNTNALKYPFNRGYMKEKYYDSNFSYLSDRSEAIADAPFFDHVTGGLMLIEKKLWQRLNGMDERLIRNQDLDLGLRASKAGVPVRMDNHYWIIHHTVNYHEKSRFFYFLKSKALFSPGILMRKHLFNFNYLKYCKRDVLYVLLLISSAIALFIKPVVGLSILACYLLIQLLRTIKSIGREEFLLRYFIFKTLFNIYVTIGFIFYFPAKPSYTVSVIQ